MDRYCWEDEGHWTAHNFIIRDRREGLLTKAMASCRDAATAEKIVKALNREVKTSSAS